jgi:hypothetical protein
MNYSVTPSVPHPFSRLSNATAGGVAHLRRVPIPRKSIPPATVRIVRHKICPPNPIPSTPTLDELRDLFLLAHPDYSFQPVCNETMLAPDNSNGPRCLEWQRYIWDSARSMAAAVGQTATSNFQRSNDPYRDLYIAEEMYSRTRKSVIAAIPGLERQHQAFKDARTPNPEELQRIREERIAEQKHEAAMARCQKVSALATRLLITQQEAEALCAHIQPTGGYQKDTLVALQVLNRYATQNGIRVTDAITVISEMV